VANRTGGRGDATREHILDIAARRFAHHAFATVGVGDVAAAAEVTKGGLYFHFSSKEALALAIMEHHAAEVRANTMQLLARQMSGLETLVDITFMVAGMDVTDHFARAAMNLEQVVRPSDRPVGLLDEWMKGSILVIEQAIAEGDVRADQDPEELASMLVSHYVGVRRTSNLDDPAAFFAGIRNSWCTSLHGFANPRRLDYLVQFVGRRASAGVRNIVESRN
jgi:AcrR family transcriptional regulator